jgi:DNA ligase-associated metallophosphoesterase
MKAPTNFTVKKQQLWLSADRTIFWEEEKALIVSDMHFGKTGHFRKAGIAIPQGVYKEDLQRLVEQIQYFQPMKLIIVGDLFHSDANKELQFFQKWRDDLSDLNIQLVKGNHDILSESWYSTMNISTHKHSLKINGFCFQHDMGNCQQQSDGGSIEYSFSGHIHPGIRFAGAGKQALKFPCFYFTNEFCILPAFSKFTGVALIEPKRGEAVFAIVNNSLIHCN